MGWMGVNCVVGNPRMVKPETVTGYRVVHIRDGKMGSLAAVGSLRASYRLGERTEYPRGEPSIIFRHLADAQAYRAYWVMGAEGPKAYLVLKVRGEVDASGKRPYKPDPCGPGPKVWCSAVTPLCIMNADGTEEGGEHRVVLTIHAELACPERDIFSRVNLKETADQHGHDMGSARAERWFGTAEPGAEIEVKTRVRSRREPERERVKPFIEARPLTVNMRCPKCRLSRYGIDPQSIPEECPSCGVLFEEAHDA